MGCTSTQPLAVMPDGMALGHWALGCESATGRPLAKTNGTGRSRPKRVGTGWRASVVAPSWPRKLARHPVGLHRRSGVRHPRVYDPAPADQPRGGHAYPSHRTDSVVWNALKYQGFFRILKTVCRVVETLRLSTLDRLEPALVLYLIIAWRIQHMTVLG